MTVSLSEIDLCKKNDENAFKALYEASVPYVYSVVSRYIKNEADRKDIIQEIFAKVFLKIKSFDEKKGEFKYWIRKISVNECLMSLRSNSNMDLVVLNTDIDSADLSGMDVDKITREDILNMLKRMPEKYKIVFMAYVIDGFSHKEIAEHMSITAETSRSQLNRAKKWVKSNIFKNNKFKMYGLF